MRKTVCELFAGVGGFRVGLNGEQDDNEWNFVWANQWEPGKKTQHAFDCYTQHFGKCDCHVNEDISAINAIDIPNHNLLVGGFPCQDYSVARTQAKGIQGHKGVLWWEINRIVKEKRPPFILLENVDRLLKSPAKQRGRDFGIMLYSLWQLGYSVEWRIINAADYGFAQKRRRVFIFAFHNKTQYYKKLGKLDNLEKWLLSHGFFQSQFPSKFLHSNLSCNLNEFEDIVEISDSFKFEFKNSGVMSNGLITTMEVNADNFIPKTLREIRIEQEVDEKYFIDNNEKKLEKFKYLKGPKKIQRVDKNGFEYFYSEGGMNFPDSLDLPGRTMLTSEGSVNRSTHVIEDFKTGRYRLLTPVECERLNGFPDNWTDTGMPENFRYFCMGNALVVSLVEKMGITLNSIFEKEKELNLHYLVNDEVAYDQICLFD
ncbi:DNA (cytosine-5-)-methyltransferase [Clostridium tunisiense]|uniref:DNA (cytosine-5-)-methyltransferase n=1 Tax=Clostridium tunisiense TaxID=219748 RepID=UPI0003183258|nr:DNA (cytosine-5-)-methyltransferase [Clostridium tunisiense]